MDNTAVASGSANDRHPTGAGPAWNQANAVFWASGAAVIWLTGPYPQPLAASTDVVPSNPANNVAPRRRHRSGPPVLPIAVTVVRSSVVVGIMIVAAGCRGGRPDHRGRDHGPRFGDGPPDHRGRGHWGRHHGAGCGGWPADHWGRGHGTGGARCRAHWSPGGRRGDHGSGGRRVNGSRRGTPRHDRGRVRCRRCCGPGKAGSER